MLIAAIRGICLNGIRIFPRHSTQVVSGWMNKGSPSLPLGGLWGFGSAHWHGRSDGNSLHIMMIDFQLFTIL